MVIAITPVRIRTFAARDSEMGLFFIWFYTDR